MQLRQRTGRAAVDGRLAECSAARARAVAAGRDALRTARADASCATAGGALRAGAATFHDR